MPTASTRRRAAAQPPEDQSAEQRAAKEHLARVVAEARRGRMTVEELAVRAGVSSGLVSQIERGVGNPSYTTLLKIGKALELPLGSFFSDPSDSDMGVVRADRRKKLLLPDGLTYESLTPDFQHQLAVLRTTVPPGFDDSDFPSRHPGEECVHVLSGALTFTSAGTTVSLEAGDSITHDSSLPHSIANTGEEPAVIVIAVTPVTF